MGEDGRVCGGREVVYVGKEVLSVLGEDGELGGSGVGGWEFEEVGKRVRGVGYICGYRWVGWSVE